MDYFRVSSNATIDRICDTALALRVRTEQCAKKKPFRPFSDWSGIVFIRARKQTSMKWMGQNCVAGQIPLLFEFFTPFQGRLTMLFSQMVLNSIRLRLTDADWAEATQP
jgi:hypothetical protein